MTVRIGLLAASRIAEKAISAVVDDVDGAVVEVVAARDPERARAYAEEHGVPQVADDYRALVEHPDVDLVYVATPAALHREWAVATLEAGKHLLCEKPLAANAEDAAVIAAAADRHAELVAAEAYHWPYHPIARQMTELVAGGAIGELVDLDASFCLPTGHIPRDDIRWDLRLGGGGLMDLGCYPISWIRHLAGGEPEVLDATADCPVEGIDATLEARLRFPDGPTATIRSAMEGDETRIELIAAGSEGTMTVTNPLAPQRGASITIERHGETTTHEVADSATYFHQLAAMVAAIEAAGPVATPVQDGVAIMAVIDDCYRAAGLQPRPTHP